MDSLHEFICQAEELKRLVTTYQDEELSKAWESFHEFLFERNKQIDEIVAGDFKVVFQHLFFPVKIVLTIQFHQAIKLRQKELGIQPVESDYELKDALSALNRRRNKRQ